MKITPWPAFAGLALAALVAAGISLPQSASADAASPVHPAHPSKLAIGFNGADISGPDDQVPYVAQFYAAERDAANNGNTAGNNGNGNGNQPATLCHAYVSWDIGLEPADAGADVPAGALPVSASRAWLEDWLKAYASTCQQALITFKWVNGVSCHYYTGCAGGTDVQALPEPEEVGASLKAFLHESWPGWNGSFAFTPWNEPNNSGAVASGFTNGRIVPARSDADYYLAMRRYCTPAIGCQIAAGDFNSNGNHYVDFIQRCADDTTTLCADASYMDVLKYYLANDATSYGLPAGFRPEYFSYHAWSDANDYLHHVQNPGVTTTCETLTDPDCVTRLTYDAFSTALYPSNTSWLGVKFWDTEVGAGQNGNTYDTSPTNDQQAQTMAFIFNLTTSISNRFQRLYYTRAWEPDGQWWSLYCSDGTAKPSLAVLVTRATSYTPTGSSCSS